MRTTLALLWLAGCSTTEATGAYGHHAEIHADDAGAELGSGPLGWRSSYAAAFRGVYFAPGDDWAVAGMDGQTCRLGYSSGSVEADEDLTGGDDTVFDGIPNDSGTDTVAVFDGTDTLTVAEFPSGRVLWSMPSPGARGARFTAEGLVVLRSTDGACELEWRDSLGTSVVQLDRSRCDGAASIEVEPAGDLAWVVAEGGLWSVTPEGDTALMADGVDRIARDGVTGAVYAAARGGSTVRALGASRWAVEVGGEVMGLDDLGPHGAAIVSVRHDDGGDRLVVLDGSTGHTLAEVSLMRSASEIAAAADGRAVAMIGDWRTDFFAVGDFGL